MHGNVRTASSGTLGDYLYNSGPQWRYSGLRSIGDGANLEESTLRGVLRAWCALT
jgi:hypothetical protein